MQEKRIAVARFSALGDVLLLWPVLEAVAAAYPGYKLTLFTRPAFLPHLPEHPGIQKVGLDIDGSHAGLGAQFFFWWGWFRSTYPEVWVDAHAHLRTALPTWMARRFGARIGRLNKYRPQRAAFLRGELEALPPVQSSYAALFAEVGFPISWPPVDVQIAVRAPSPVLLLAPFSAQRTKCMPLSTASELARRWADAGGEVVLLGSPTECSTWPGPPVQTIPQSAERAFWQTAAAAVVTDSANQHLAALHGTPSVTLWTGTSPRAGFGPVQSAPHIDLQPEGLDCHPCSIFGQSACARGDFACQSVPLEKIWAAIAQVARTEVPLSR